MPRSKKIPDTHRGWKISNDLMRPVTGQWVAEKHGVTLCAVTKMALQEVIENHEKDRLTAIREASK